MYKKLAVALLVTTTLSACGGGGSSAPATQPTAQKLSFYGNPLGSTPTKTAKAQTRVARDATASGTAVTDTVESLTDALAAQGVTATITPQVMDGTTLHALIMGSDNGLPPTPDQFKTDPSGWLVVNFQLDDMVTPPSDPTQSAAMQQFKSDLEIFIQRAHVSGKQVFVVLPILTCDVQNGLSAADGLTLMVSQASGQAGGMITGQLPYTYAADANGKQVNTYIAGHMGADCRTPDAYLLNARTDKIAADIAAGLAALNAAQASSASATTTTQ